MKQLSLNKICFVLAVMITARTAAQPITVTLKANYNNTVNVYHDESLLLSVTLSNQVAQENSRWNKAADRRLNELEQLLKENKISKEEYNKEKNKLQAGKKKVLSVTVGASGRSWSSMVSWKMINTSGKEVPLKVRTMVNPSAEDVAVLNEKGYYVAYFGIDAGEMKAIPAGTYKIQAVLEGEKSEAVSLILKSEMMPASIAGSEAILLKNGQYYWHTGDATAGLQYADKLLLKNPFSVEGHSLKGDLQLLNNSYLPALDSYNKALKEFYRQNPGISEPPEYLLGTIEWVKKQIGQ